MPVECFLASDSLLIMPQVRAFGSVRRLATDAPLHISDDGLATLIHMDMFDPDSLRAAVPQPA
jgi:hypothetical protein